MNDTMKEAIECVEILNDLWYDQKINEIDPFTFLCANYYMCIQFMDITIWDDQDRDRDWNEETDSYESIMTCVVRRINEYRDMLNNFKLPEGK